MLKPHKLAPGDRLAAVSLSWGGPGTFPHRYEAGKRQLEEAFGVELVAMPHALKAPDWLAAHPESRAEDLMAAFSNPAIQGIVSTIGGEDSIRILPYLDLDVIRAHPKVFLGYSDTTVAHFACLKAGVVSFYGPSVMAGFGENGGMFPYMVESVRRTLFSTEPIGALEPNRDGWTVEYLDWSIPGNQERRRTLNPSEPWRFLQGEGTAEGQLVGGCLEVVEFLRGTPIWPDGEVWDGAILFLETSEDAPSAAVLRYALRTWAAMGILRRLSGILFGRPGGPVPPEDFGKYEDALLQVVATEEGLTRLPIVTRMDFGHTDPMFVLPYGVRARIDCEGQRFSIVESAVADPGGPT
ncbi:MAG TPA: S66 peptidase family protein [Thermoanaerobaculia bacterium]|jgi:muramoyltetrapeptide carboxypeptidase LdcA involved in peptidoglycan recycling